MSVSDTVTIRPAVGSDVPSLGRLGASLMRLHHAFDTRRFMAAGDDADEGYAQFLEMQMASGNTCVLVAERQAEGHPPELIGYVYAAVEPISWKELRDEAGFIHDLLVSDSARGAGIGPRLLDAAVDWLRQRGMPRVLLWTAAPNARARQLFESRGFRATMVEMTLELE